MRARAIFLSACLAIGTLSLFSCPSISAQPAGPTKTQTETGVPVGMVSAQEALRQIRAHEETIETRLKHLTQVYDKNASDTLKEVFIQKEVHPIAWDLISPWSGNGVYLLWVDGLRGYYTYHLDALRESARPLAIMGEPFMKASDLEYLDRGMQVWQQREPLAASLMTTYVDRMAQHAFYLGEARKITSDNRYYMSSSPEFRRAHEREVTSNSDKANDAEKVVGEAKEQAKAAGRWRVFSSISAQDRVTVAESPLRSYSIHNLVVSRSDWEVRQVELQQQAERLAKDLEILRGQADEQLQRIAQAFENADALAQEKLEIDRRILAKTEQFEELSKPTTVPQADQVLYQQKQFTERSLQDTEDKILLASQEARHKELPSLFEEREGLRAQLRRINQTLKQKMPALRVDESSLAERRSELDRLEAQYWEKRKQEMHALSEIDLVGRLIDGTFSEIDKIAERSEQLELEKRQMDENGIPCVRAIEVQAHGQTVYRAEWQGAVEELEAKTREISEMEAELTQLKEIKDQTLLDFQTRSQEAGDILTSLHGNSLAQGNGVWATLKEVVSNDGAILANARKQASIDFGMNAYEVFVEGWRKGGPAGAIVETMSKVAMAGIQYGGEDATGLLDTSAADSDGIHHFSTPEVTKMLTYRAVEDGLLRRVRNLGDRTAGAQMLKRFARPDRLKYLQISGTPGVTAEDLRAIGQRVNLNRRRLMQLSSPKTYRAADLGSSLLKDAIKQSLKQWAQVEENELWEAFLLAQAGQVNLYQLYGAAAEAYWTGYDKLQSLKEQRAELADGYDPVSGFRILVNQPFDDKATLSISINLSQAEGHQETVTFSGAKALQTRPQEFQLRAASIPHSDSDPSPVELRIMQH